MVTKGLPTVIYRDGGQLRLQEMTIRCWPCDGLRRWCRVSWRPSELVSKVKRLNASNL